mgnify:CR=1 FL=1
MKTLVSVLKNIFTPFSAFAFLLLGLLACFCSAMIEVFVLKELLEVPGLGINAKSWAILIVLVLEGSKFTLHFYAEALKRRGLSEEIDDFDIEKKRKLIVGVKNSLVVLSLVCSMICMVNILYNNNDEKIDAYIQENSAYCDEKLLEGTQELEEKRESRTEELLSIYASEQESINLQRDNLETILDMIANEVYINRRQDLQEEAEAVRSQIEQAENTYTIHKEEAQMTAQEEYEAEYTKLEEKYGNSGTERVTATDPKALMAGDNSYLSNFLNAFTKTFLGTGYSRAAYFLCTLFISLIVAIVLELCISISQMLLTIKAESFVKIIGEIPKIEKGKEAVRLVIWLMFSVLIATAVYCIASIILQNHINGEQTAMALVTYIVTILLINALIPKKQSEGVLNYLSEKNEKVKPLFTSLSNIISDVLIPAAISFVGYMLIGFAFHGDFIYGDMTGLAIAIGGAFSKLLKFEQCEFAI